MIQSAIAWCVNTQGNKSIPVGCMQLNRQGFLYWMNIGSNAEL